MDQFIFNYLALVQTHFPHLNKAKNVPEWILEGTKLMLNNVKTAVNKDIFLQYFSQKSGMTEYDIWEIFLQFYNSDYDRLKEITFPIPEAQSFIYRARQAGYHLVLATQPVFPQIAIMKRLSWAGVDHRNFVLITHIENMSACKPNPAYYNTILDVLNTDSTNCIMIGNDLEMDMAAANVGMTTYFLNYESEVCLHPGATYTGGFKKLEKLLGI
jgi:FMN phosphatase YigB (HAD superfamily)